MFQWGKAPYIPAEGTTPGENGGITGIVYYSTTRAENNPQYGAAEVWEPGIPRVQVNLYQADPVTNNLTIKDTNGNGTLEYADVDNFPFGWSDGTSPAGTEDIDRNANGTFDLGDALAMTTTDSWDDNLPAGCKGDTFTFQGSVKDCYDGLRVFNQVRPGVFDGGYAFGSPAGGSLAKGVYIVEAVPPPGYELVKEEDKNVDFGEDIVPSPLALPPVCVGESHDVPQYLTLFADQQIEVANWTAGMTRPLCDRKQVFLADGQNAAADFFLFTKAPIAGHIYGFILDDTQNEFDPNAPNFGEKFAPPWLPISIRDWTGREISRTLSDQYGVYNALVPSTYSANLPQPSGMSPSMLTVCLNSPTSPETATPDPLYNPQYSQYCYTFQYMPGTTTYLDTPVLPVAAFAGPGQYPLDAEFTDRDAQDQTGNRRAVCAFRGWFACRSCPKAMCAVPNPAYCPGPPMTSATECPVVDQNRTITRDYGFGADGTVSLVAADGTSTALATTAWSATGITATVPGGLPDGSYQLVVTRTDTGKSSITGVTVQKGLRPGASVRSCCRPSAQRNLSRRNSAGNRCRQPQRPDPGCPRPVRRAGCHVETRSTPGLGTWFRQDQRG